MIYGPVRRDRIVALTHHLKLTGNTGLEGQALEAFAAQYYDSYLAEQTEGMNRQAFDQNYRNIVQQDRELQTRIAQYQSDAATNTPEEPAFETGAQQTSRARTANDDISDDEAPATGHPLLDLAANPDAGLQTALTAEEQADVDAQPTLAELAARPQMNDFLHADEDEDADNEEYASFDDGTLEEAPEHNNTPINLHGVDWSSVSIFGSTHETTNAAITNGALNEYQDLRNLDTFRIINPLRWYSRDPEFLAALVAHARQKRSEVDNLEGDDVNTQLDAIGNQQIMVNYTNDPSNRAESFILLQQKSSLFTEVSNDFAAPIQQVKYNQDLKALVFKDAKGNEYNDDDHRVWKKRDSRLGTGYTAEQTLNMARLFVARRDIAAPEGERASYNAHLHTGRGLIRRAFGARPDQNSKLFRMLAMSQLLEADRNNLEVNLFDGPTKADGSKQAITRLDIRANDPAFQEMADTIGDTHGPDDALIETAEDRLHRLIDDYNERFRAPEATAEIAIDPATARRTPRPNPSVLAEAAAEGANQGPEGAPQAEHNNGNTERPFRLLPHVAARATDDTSNIRPGRDRNAPT